MRILFTFVGGAGHFDPLVPIAYAALAIGHDIAFCSRSDMVSKVQAAGFAVYATGEFTGDTSKRLPLLEPNMNHEYQVLRDFFAYKTARQRANDLVKLCDQWQPDLIVCDEIDFGSMIAAEYLGLPYASVLVIASGSFVRKNVVAEPLNTVRAEFGLPADPELEALSRYLVLSQFPKSFRDPNIPLPTTAHLFRTEIADTQNKLSLTSGYLQNMPTIYFTLGTIFDRESGDLFWRVINGLRDLPINMIVTVGHHLNPAEFGMQPPNIHVEQYIPQEQILPHCDLVISHGGSGSVLGALKYGLPCVLLPIGADQPLNAARCEALGVGLVLDVMSVSPDDICSAASKVMSLPTYRLAAERLRNEWLALPSVEYVINLLERLGKEKRPLHSQI